MKMTGVCRLLVYVDDANLVEEKNTEVVKAANKKAGLEVNKKLSILWHIDPLLGNDSERSSYTSAVVK
jgi:hypothetical protein